MPLRCTRRRWLAAAGAGLLGTGLQGTGALGAASALAATDRVPLPAGLDLLERPAPASAHATRRLLLDVAPGGPGLVAVGTAGLLLGSADEGRSWQQLPSPTSVMLTALHFADAAHGWAVGHDGVVLATTDAGRHWQRCFDGRQANALMLAAAQAQVAQADALKGPDAERLQQARDRAADALAAATDAVKAGPSRPLLAVRFADRQRGWVAGAFGQLFATDDGGRHWRYIGDRLNNPEGLHLNSLTLDADGRLLLAAEAGAVFRSRDGGHRWQRSDTGYAGHLYGVLALPDPDGPTLLAYGFNGHLFRSTDEGAQWAAVALPSRRTLVAAAQRGDQALLLTEQGELLASTDAGRSFAVANGRLGSGRLTGWRVGERRLVLVGAGGVSAQDWPGEPR